MISDPNQTPDPSANYTDKNRELYSDPWADSSDEPEAEAPREEIVTDRVNAKEAPVLNLKPKSEMAASVSEESNWDDEDDESYSDPVQEVSAQDVIFTETTRAIATDEAVTAQEEIVAETTTAIEEAVTAQEEIVAETTTAIEATEAEVVETRNFASEVVETRNKVLQGSNESEVVESHESSEEGDRLTEDVAELRRQKAALEAEILELEANRGRLLQENVAELQSTLGQMIQDSLGELQQRKQALQISVEQLERRQERIRKEMQTSFAGVSQDLAIRVQGFKDYLVGSLQDLVTAAEELEMAPKQRSPEPAPEQLRSRSSGQRPPKRSANPDFGEGKFEEQAQQIRRVLKQFRTQPDYYGPPWQLRRTFEPIHAERVSNWFFTQGGRGALRTMGSRLQNILVASAVMSCLRKIHGNRFRTLVLADSPERLGEWRRGLQDCLGISRSDFGPERGVVLFEDPDALSQKAERLVKNGMMPLILIDETEDNINLGVLQFPLWLAFAAEPRMASSSSSNW